MDTNDILLEKSQNNLHIAETAEELSYLDVAVSRYYYCVYQKILWILFKKVNQYSVDKNNGEGSHELAFSHFRRYVYKRASKKLDPKDMYVISNLEKSLGDIKRFRVSADYGQRKITDEEFNKVFKVKYFPIRELVDKVINIVK